MGAAEEEETSMEREGDVRRSSAAGLPPMGEEEIEKVEGIMGYRFGNRRLVEEALTHPSFYYPEKAGVTYERLEYVGDGVLTCVVAREMFLRYPELPPGMLTRLRAANVDTEKLARAAVDSGLYRFMRHKAPQLDAQVQVFVESMRNHPMHSNGLLDPPKTLADIIESLLGAVFIDDDDNNSLSTVWEVYRRLAEPLISLETLGKHPVSELYEFCQKQKMSLKILKETWAENTIVDVLIDGNLAGSATYANKKDVAQNRAAKAALDWLNQTLSSEEPTTAAQSS